MTDPDISLHADSSIPTKYTSAPEEDVTHSVFVDGKNLHGKSVNPAVIANYTKYYRVSFLVSCFADFPSMSPFSLSLTQRKTGKSTAG
jgi:hypothetical protein